MSARPGSSALFAPARWPRLLNRRQAAEYLGISVDTFDRICPVQPVDLGMRGVRFDREKLDAWIDVLTDGGLHAGGLMKDSPPDEMDADVRRQKSLERLKCQKKR